MRAILRRWVKRIQIMLIRAQMRREYRTQRHLY